MKQEKAQPICPPLPAVFFIFYFCFLQKIYFQFGNLQEYTPAAPLPGGRDLAARQRGGKGISEKNSRRKLRADPWSRSPGSGAAGPGRPAAGRPALPPLYKGWLVLLPLICITKITETKKKEGGREGERRSPAGFSSWRLQVTKIFYIL